MKKNDWQIQIRNKYYHLLGMLITFLFILPFTPSQIVHLPIISLIFLLGIIFTLRAVQTNSKAFWAVTLTGILAYIFQVVSGFFITQESRPIFYLVTGIIFSIFILMSVMFLIVKMFTAKEITSDTILLPEVLVFICR
jgi:apolipoprotein N-acyltransferase